MVHFCISGIFFKGLNKNKNGCKACDDKQVSAKKSFSKAQKISDLIHYVLFLQKRVLTELILGL